jgi:hypothetical protein
MARVLIAEYDAAENALRLVEPLTGVKDHEQVRVSVEQQSHAATAVARLATLDGPTGDIEQMLSEIEAGRR